MVEIPNRLAVLCLLVLSLSAFAAARNIITAQRERSVVYTRKVHREIPKHVSDIEYVDHIYEIFNTRQMPPPDMFDAQAIDQFIRCDFNPGLKECIELRERKRLPDGRVTPTTLKPSTKQSEPTKNPSTKPTTNTSNEFVEPIPHLPKDVDEQAYEEAIDDDDHYKDEDYKDDDNEEPGIKDYDDDGEMIAK